MNISEFPQQQQPHQWLYRLSVSPLSSGNHKAFQCGQRHLLQRVDRTLGLNSYSLKRNGTASPLSCACPKSKIYWSGVGFPDGKYLSQSAFAFESDMAFSQLWSMVCWIICLTFQTGQPHSDASARNTLWTLKESCKSMISPPTIVTVF